MVEQKSKLPTGLEGIHSLTMSRFTLQLQKHSGGTGDFTLLINSVTIACKVVESCVRRAGIAKLYGLAGDQNVQGEDQKKLDIIANDAFKDNLIDCKQVAVMVSEEDDLAIVCDQSKNAKYAIAFDPLDGSSNIDANVSIGTIFAIYRIPDGAVINTPDDAAKVIMQVGREMVCAGYAMYGSATNLVISFGLNNGVHGFTLDPSIGEFVLTHPSITIPKSGKIYSVNEGNARNWNKPTTAYVQNAKYKEDGSNFSLRYIGSMVADVHRTLLYGGVFMYPADAKNETGKLRLLYEAAPMAFLMESAGGKASTGSIDILDIMPESIHQRVPVYMGSSNEVDAIVELFKSES